MIEKIKALCIKYREILVYIIVGGMTTVVSWGCKFLWGAIFYPGVTIPTVAQNTVLVIVENVAGILFAARYLGSELCTQSAADERTAY